MAYLFVVYHRRICKTCITPLKKNIGLIQVKEEGWTGFSSGWQGYFEGFPEGEAQGNSQGAALPALGKPVHPSSFTWINPVCVLLFHLTTFSPGQNVSKHRWNDIALVCHSPPHVMLCSPSCLKLHFMIMKL